MTKDEITTMRTELANKFAEAGAAFLDFTGTAAALVAIPDTNPQQYAAAGTLETIRRIWPQDEAAATVLTDERIHALWKQAIEQFQRHEAGVSLHPSVHLARAIEAELLAHAGKAVAAEEPAGLVNQLIQAMRVDFIEHARAFGEKAFADYFERWITVDKIMDSVPTYATSAVSCRDAVRALESALAAPTIVAQVPAAEVRAQVLREAAELCGLIYQNHRDQYKGRGKYAPPAENPRRADPHCDGCADGAAECEEAIRALAHQSTADSAGTGAMGDGAE